MPLKHTAILFAALMITPLIHAAEHGRKYRDAASALKAAKEAKTDDDVNEALQEVAAQKMQTNDDVKTMYESLQLMDSKYLDERKSQKLALVRSRINQNLASSTAPLHHAIVASLLEYEAKGISTGLPKISGKMMRQEFARVERFEALAVAAGRGKNMKALPVLRKVADEHPDSMYSERAITAIGEIGESQDLEHFIQKLKSNPKSRINLHAFGPRLIVPVMRELEASNLTEQQKGALRTTLSEGHSHEAIPQYVALLKHSDARIVRVAARAIAQDAGEGDAEVLLSMLKDAKSEVRFPAVNAIAGQAWNEKYIGALIDLLKNDKDDGVRVRAMTALAEHNVRSAIPVIQDATRDTNSRIRENAEYLLKRMPNK